MATFKEGQSMKSQRIQVVAHFDQKGPNMTGKNVAFGIANDTREMNDGPNGVITDPMLMYKQYTDKDGKKQNYYTEGYSEEQWNKVLETANMDGDKPVFIADVHPSKNGKGLVVNTNSLQPTDVPFDHAKHKENTKERRAVKAAERSAKAKEAQAEPEVEDALERE